LLFRLFSVEQHKIKFEKRTFMHDHRTDLLQAAIACLLVILLPACTRSASPALTPLPSLPPFTATAAAPTATPRIATATSTPGGETTPSAEPPKTESSSIASATATRASAAQASATPACGSALPTRLRVDLFAYVNPDPPLPNNLRSEAGQENTLLGEIQPGEAMQILEGPACADGSLWWKVRALATQLEGWTAEGDAQTYWLVPCSSEEACQP
jgi:hypothetical protein